MPYLRIVDDFFRKLQPSVLIGLLDCFIEIFVQQFQQAIIRAQNGFGLR